VSNYQSFIDLCNVRNVYPCFEELEVLGVIHPKIAFETR